MRGSCREQGLVPGQSREGIPATCQWVPLQKGGCGSGFILMELSPGGICPTWIQSCRVRCGDPKAQPRHPPPPWVPGPPWDVDAPRTLAGFTYKKWGEIQLCSPSSTWRIPRAGKDPGTIRQRQAGRMRPPAKPGGLFAPSLLAF